MKKFMFAMSLGLMFCCYDAACMEGSESSQSKEYHSKKHHHHPSSTGQQVNHMTEMELEEKAQGIVSNQEQAQAAVNQTEPIWQRLQQRYEGKRFKKLRDMVSRFRNNVKDYGNDARRLRALAYVSAVDALAEGIDMMGPSSHVLNDLVMNDLVNKDDKIRAGLLIRLWISRAYVLSVLLNNSVEDELYNFYCGLAGRFKSEERERAKMLISKVFSVRDVVYQWIEGDLKEKALLYGNADNQDDGGDNSQNSNLVKLNDRTLLEPQKWRDGTNAGESAWKCLLTEEQGGQSTKAKESVKTLVKTKWTEGSDGQKKALGALLKKSGFQGNVTQGTIFTGLNRLFNTTGSPFQSSGLMELMALVLERNLVVVGDDKTPDQPEKKFEDTLYIVKLPDGIYVPAKIIDQKNKAKEPKIIKVNDGGRELNLVRQDLGQGIERNACGFLCLDPECTPENRLQIKSRKRLINQLIEIVSRPEYQRSAEDWQIFRLLENMSKQEGYEMIYPWLMKFLEGQTQDGGQLGFWPNVNLAEGGNDFDENGLINAIALMQHRNIVIVQDGQIIFRTNIKDVQDTIYLGYIPGHFVRLVPRHEVEIDDEKIILEECSLGSEETDIGDVSKLKTKLSESLMQRVKEKGIGTKITNVDVLTRYVADLECFRTFKGIRKSIAANSLLNIVDLEKVLDKKMSPADREAILNYMISQVVVDAKKTNYTDSHGDLVYSQAAESWMTDDTLMMALPCDASIDTLSTQDEEFVKEAMNIALNQSAVGEEAIDFDKVKDILLRASKKCQALKLITGFYEYKQLTGPVWRKFGIKKDKFDPENRYHIELVRWLFALNNYVRYCQLTSDSLRETAVNREIERVEPLLVYTPKYPNAVLDSKNRWKNMCSEDYLKRANFDSITEIKDGLISGITIGEEIYRRDTDYLNDWEEKDRRVKADSTRKGVMNVFRKAIILSSLIKIDQNNSFILSRGVLNQLFGDRTKIAGDSYDNKYRDLRQYYFDPNAAVNLDHVYAILDGEEGDLVNRIMHSEDKIFAGVVAAMINISEDLKSSSGVGNQYLIDMVRAGDTDSDGLAQSGLSTEYYSSFVLDLMTALDSIFSRDGGFCDNPEILQFVFKYIGAWVDKYWELLKNPNFGGDTEINDKKDKDALQNIGIMTGHLIQGFHHCNDGMSVSLNTCFAMLSQCLNELLSNADAEEIKKFAMSQVANKAFSAMFDFVGVKIAEEKNNNEPVMRVENIRSILDGCYGISKNQGVVTLGMGKVSYALMKKLFERSIKEKKFAEVIKETEGEADSFKVGDFINGHAHEERERHTALVRRIWELYLEKNCLLMIIKDDVISKMILRAWEIEHPQGSGEIRRTYDDGDENLKIQIIRDILTEWGYFRVPDGKK